MKNIFLAVLLGLLLRTGNSYGLTVTNAQGFLSVTNSTWVVLGWTPSPDPAVNGYNIYCGVASGKYTNLVHFGNVTNATISLPGRGVTYYFACTATEDWPGGDEAVFSNEASYFAKPLPNPVTLNPVTKLVVQKKNLLEDFMWADTDMEWIIAPEDKTFYRLAIETRPPPVATLTAQPLSRPRPPLPPAP
jgi:hypothetical protein